MSDDHDEAGDDAVLRALDEAESFDAPLPAGGGGEAGNSPGSGPHHDHCPTDGAADDFALAREPRNDYGNGRRMIARFGADLLHIKELEWHVWDERRWDRGHGCDAAARRAHAMAEAILTEAEALRATLGKQLEDDLAAGLVGAKEAEAREKENEDQVDKHRKWAIASGNWGKVAPSARGSRHAADGG